MFATPLRLATLLLLGSATGAYAQTATLVPNAPAPMPSNEAPHAADTDIADIVVTGTPMGRTKLSAPFAIRPTATQRLPRPRRPVW